MGRALDCMGRRIFFSVFLGVTMVYSWWRQRWDQAATAGATLGREGMQVLAGALGAFCPCHQWLEEVGPQHLCWGRPPAPASQVLGPWGVGGWFFAGG